MEITATDTHDLRRRVLRVGTVTTEVRFAEDELPDTFHLGVETSHLGVETSSDVTGIEAGHLGVETGSDVTGVEPRLVAISTWVWRRHPDHPAVEGAQLRGMATDESVRGTGCGALLLQAGIARCRELGAGHVWARARDAALDFYLAHGFVTFGPGYTDLPTGLPHHDVIRHFTLNPRPDPTATSPPPP